MLYDEMKHKIRKYFDFYEQQVIPAIKSNDKVTQTDFWLHWLYTHTDSVVFRWIYYALCLREDPLPVIFACAFHDLARTDDIYNEIHWKNAVPIVKEIMKAFSDVLSDDWQRSIIYAVENHTTWVDAPDYISACLWDADRTRVSWMYWYNESFLTTDESKLVASWSIRKFLEFQNECLNRELHDDREDVLLYETMVKL